MKEQAKCESKSLLLFTLQIIAMCLVTAASYLLRDTIKTMSAWGYAGVLAACFIGNAGVLVSSSIPIVLILSSSLEPLLLGIAAGIGSSLGEMLAYCAGRGISRVVHMKTKNRFCKKAQTLFQKSPFAAIVLFSVLPLPVFDVIGVMAGVEQIHPLKFICACLLGKTMKFSLIAAAAANIPVA